MAGEVLSCEIVGLDSLEQNLNRFADVVRRDIVQSGLVAGSVVLAKAQQEHAPVQQAQPDGRYGGLLNQPGMLRDEILVDIDMESSANVQSAAIGPSKEAANVPLWVEFGHELVSHGRRARDRRVIGQVEPHPFILPAFEESANAALQACEDAILQGIEDADFGRNGENLLGSGS